MSRLGFVEELEFAANRIADTSRADLQVMLRRAALVLRNVDGFGLDPKIDEPLAGLADEMGISKPDLINTIIGDWLVANAYLPVAFLDEETGTAGTA